MAADDTAQLLDRWYGGDENALDALMQANVEWMQRHIRPQLTPRLRRRFDSADLVQEAAMRLLKYGPKFAPENRAQFRALLSRILVTALRDKVDALHAAKRDSGMEESATTRALGARANSSLSPSSKAARKEMQDWVTLALEAMDPVERRLIVMRKFEDRSFDEIARTLGISNTDAARMRFNRALPKLATKIRELQRAARKAVDSVVSDADLGN